MIASFGSEWVRSRVRRRCFGYRRLHVLLKREGHAVTTKRCSLYREEKLAVRRRGGRFRILAVVDDCTRESLTLVADTSLSGLRVARELDRLIAERGKPKMIVSDNGSEFTSNAILAWADQARVEWHYIAPGKPMQNGFIESF